MKDQQVVLLTATVTKDHPDEEYCGWINEEEGCIAQGKTIEEVKSELLKIYWIMLYLKRKNKKS